MHETIDPIMEQASHALVDMDYLTCEARCLDALQIARTAQLWGYYARILLPLQESRRQRRMIAAEGTIRLGFASQSPDDTAWLEKLRAGCVLFTAPYSVQEAQHWHGTFRARRLHIEVLFAQPSTDQRSLLLRSVAGPSVTCSVPAPQSNWSNRWLQPGAVPALPNGKTPADWFIDATESLGDAALKTVTAPLGQVARVEQLEACLHVVEDHEILHQRLAQAAKALEQIPGSAPA